MFVSLININEKINGEIKIILAFINPNLSNKIWCKCSRSASKGLLFFNILMKNNLNMSMSGINKMINITSTKIFISIFLL